MRKNIVWVIIFILVVIVTGYRTIQLGFDLWKYHFLSLHIPVDSINFSVQEFYNDRFGAKGDYTYTVNGQKYRGSIVLDEPVYRNQESMEKTLPQLSAKKWEIWVDPTNPTRSVVEKYFPIKEIIYVIILWALLFYFIWLRYYAENLQNK